MRIRDLIATLCTIVTSGVYWFWCGKITRAKESQLRDLFQSWHVYWFCHVYPTILRTAHEFDLRKGFQRMILTPNQSEDLMGDSSVRTACGDLVRDLLLS